MKTDKGQLRMKQDKIRQKLAYRLQLNNIYRQFQLISNMNQRLEINLSNFALIDILRHLTKQQLLRIVDAIPFICYSKGTPLHPEQHFRLDYQNAHKLVLVTGIQRQCVENMITQFCNGPKHLSQYLKGQRQNQPKIINSNQFWICIEATSEQTASFLKKYLRNEKRNMDENQRTDYKIMHRRIRIVIVKQDLFTLLIDAMTEVKAELFNRSFQHTSSNDKRRNTQEQNQITSIPQANKMTVLYRPLVNMYTNSQNYANKSDNRQQELSDGFSQSTSLNSDLFDPNKMKDIIETSDQGIQSQINLSFKEGETDVYAIASPHSSPSASEDKTIDQIQKQELLENKHDEQTILRCQILRSDAEEYGLDVQLPEQKVLLRSPIKPEQNPPQDNIIQDENKEVTLPFKKMQQPSTPIFFHQKPRQAECQTQQPLYTVMPISLMRKCLQEFKKKQQSTLVEMPDWLKSESQNQRNRHRFFSSLVRPKLIHRRRPF